MAELLAIRVLSEIFAERKSRDLALSSTGVVGENIEVGVTLAWMWR